MARGSDLRYPSWACPRCGESIGWLGRIVEFALGWLVGRHKCLDDNPLGWD